MAEIFNFSTIEKTSYRSLSHKKFQKRQNDRKGRYIVLHIFEQITKVKIEDEGPKKTQSFKVVS